MTLIERGLSRRVGLAVHLLLQELNFTLVPSVRLVKAPSGAGQLCSRPFFAWEWRNGRLAVRVPVIQLVISAAFGPLRDRSKAPFHRPRSGSERADGWFRCVVRRTPPQALERCRSRQAVGQVHRPRAVVRVSYRGGGFLLPGCEGVEEFSKRGLGIVEVER